MNRLPDCPWHPAPGVACAHCDNPANWSGPPFTPYAALGTPIDLVRRFGRPRLRHWLLDSLAGMTFSTMYAMSCKPRRPALFLDTK